MHNFPLLTMPRGECRSFRAPLRPRKGGPPFYVFFAIASNRPSRHVRKGADHRMKYSKNKKNVASLILHYYRFRTRAATWWTMRTRQESATCPYLWYKKIRTSTPTCVKLRVIFERQTYIYIYIYNISVLRFLWTHTDLVPWRLFASGNNNARFYYCEIKLKFVKFID